MYRHIRYMIVIVILILILLLLEVKWYWYLHEETKVQKLSDPFVIECYGLKQACIEKNLKKPTPLLQSEYADIHFSQDNQDQIVYDILKRNDGFFVEMGGFDGKTFSNTLWLERQHSWTGLLVEANPSLCKAIDELKRNVWRLCGCISSAQNTTFIKAGALGGSIDTLGPNRLETLVLTNNLTVPCFKLDEVLSKIGIKRINYFSLDVEGGELTALKSIKNELISKEIVVDVWTTIEYMVWNGKSISKDESKKNLESLRTFFQEIGGYYEHSHLLKTSDAVFVNINSACISHKQKPYGSVC
ncbi:unnamed protein product [Mytilus coruscus]|uniref:Methyltransferase FkbM domain-containing protein n=1 Tax=Mytilus coruscus TaxID=42192 RepID=A0A6J8BT54_MYTCO|nr:unnamed protein product [Mytilus coruscus]